MPEHGHIDDEAMVNRETHREKSDVNVRALLWFLAIFIVFAALSHGLIFIMFKQFARLSSTRTNAPLTEVSRPAVAPVPVLPRLQPFPGANAPYTTTPVFDMDDMRRAEEQALRDPAWIDRQKGIVRLPIDVAKRLVVQRGLPVVQQGVGQ